MTPISVQYLERFKEHHVHIRDAESWSAFQELIQRGANLWPDAPPEIKEFADMVTNGRVMQDYYRQANKEQSKPDVHTSGVAGYAKDHESCCEGGPQWGHAWNCKKLVG